MDTPFEKAIIEFDRLNSSDPNIETWNDITYPKEVLYSMRMTETLKKINPNASETVQLAARCQHICRWQISRSEFEPNRIGYLKWRTQLYKFHAKKASEVLMQVGYDEKTIKSVAFLLQKKQLKKNEETQQLEDVVCIVFINYYFEKFSKKYSEKKLIEILQKTWVKMSKKGQQITLKLQLSNKTKLLIEQALKAD